MGNEDRFFLEINTVKTLEALVSTYFYNRKLLTRYKLKTVYIILPLQKCYSTWT